MAPQNRAGAAFHAVEVKQGLTSRTLTQVKRWGTAAPAQARGSELSQTDTDENRRGSSRSNVMLAATIEVGGLGANVRVRNLSETGALIEGAQVPPAGTKLNLKRFDLVMPATVAWARGGRAGLHFDGVICVPEWIHQGHVARVASSAGQQRVDSIQAAVRSGLYTESAGPALPAPAVPAALSSHLDKRLAEEIAYVQRLLEATGDELIGEPVVVHRHAGVLQNFDLVSQILGHVAAILTAEDQVKAVEQVGMQELRARLLRAIGPDAEAA